MPTTFAFPDEKDSEEEKHSGEKSRFVKGQDFEVNSADDDHNENYYEDRAFNSISTTFDETLKTHTGEKLSNYAHNENYYEDEIRHHKQNGCFYDFFLISGPPRFRNFRKIYQVLKDFIEN